MSESGGRSAFIVGAGILISRVFGLVRQLAYAHFFGATSESDAFNAALKIPNALRNLLGEGTLAAAFVPAYSRLLEEGDEQQSRAMANAVLGLLLAVVAGLTILGIALAPHLTTFAAPGLAPDTHALATRLTRVMFPMSGVMVLSGWCLGVQNSHRRFFWSYASAALWSLAQIVLLVAWGPRAVTLEQLAWWLAWATLVGSMLQVAIQLPEVVRLLGVVRPIFSRAVAGVAPVMRNMLPVITAVGVVQISSFIDQQIASFLPEGSISSMMYANVIILLPVSLFGVSVAASSLPDLSRAVNREALRERVRGGWQRILFYIVPSAVALVAFGDYCNGIIYRGGRFGAEQQQIVHFVIAAYAVGLVSFASVKLLASAFYALQDYRTPLRASLASLAISATAAAAMALPLRHTAYATAGIALGSALGSYTNFVVLIRKLRAQLGPLYTPLMWIATRRILGSALVALIVALPLRLVFDTSRPRLFGPIVLGVFGLVYLLSAWWFGSAEAARLLRRPVRTGNAAQ